MKKITNLKCRCGARHAVQQALVAAIEEHTAGSAIAQIVARAVLAGGVKIVTLGVNVIVVAVCLAGQTGGGLQLRMLLPRALAREAVEAAETFGQHFPHGAQINNY